MTERDLNVRVSLAAMVYALVGLFTAFGLYVGDVDSTGTLERIVWPVYWIAGAVLALAYIDAWRYTE